MPSALDDRISRWEAGREDQARKTEQNTKTLTVKVAPDVADHLHRLAKATKTSRTTLVREIFDDGYAKLCKAEKRIQRKARPADPAWVSERHAGGGRGRAADQTLPPAG